MKRIKSFEQACKGLGVDPDKVLPDVSGLPDMDQKAVIALAKMCVINRELNGSWKPDWSDYNQPKYYPWFNVNPKEGTASGFGLSFDVYGYDSTRASLGVRLYYKDGETARYAGETFTDLYEDLILLPK